MDFKRFPPGADPPVADVATLAHVHFVDLRSADELSRKRQSGIESSVTPQLGVNSSAGAEESLARPRRRTGALLGSAPAVATTGAARAW
jgi:hypothetical protein